MLNSRQPQQMNAAPLPPLYAVVVSKWVVPRPTKWCRPVCRSDLSLRKLMILTCRLTCELAVELKKMQWKMQRAARTTWKRKTPKRTAQCSRLTPQTWSRSASGCCPMVLTSWKMTVSCPWATQTQRHKAKFDLISQTFFSLISQIGLITECA